MTKKKERKKMKTRYTACKLDRTMNAADHITETDTTWVMEFTKKIRVVYDRYVSEEFESGTVVTVEKKKTKGYMGCFHNATINKA